MHTVLFIINTLISICIITGGGMLSIDSVGEQIRSCPSIEHGQFWRLFAA